MIDLMVDLEEIWAAAYDDDVDRAQVIETYPAYKMLESAVDRFPARPAFDFLGKNIRGVISAIRSISGRNPFKLAESVRIAA